MPQVDEVTAESVSWFPRPFEINPQIFDFDQSVISARQSSLWPCRVRHRSNQERPGIKTVGSPHIVPDNAETSSLPWGIRGRTHPWYGSRTMPLKTKDGLFSTISQDYNSHGLSLNLEVNCRPTHRAPPGAPGHPRVPRTPPDAPNVLTERVQVRHCKAAEESAQWSKTLCKQRRVHDEGRLTFDFQTCDLHHRSHILRYSASSAAVKPGASHTGDAANLSRSDARVSASWSRSDTRSAAMRT